MCDSRYVAILRDIEILERKSDLQKIQYCHLSSYFLASRGEVTFLHEARKWETSTRRLPSFLRSRSLGLSNTISPSKMSVSPSKISGSSYNLSFKDCVTSPEIICVGGYPTPLLYRLTMLNNVDLQLYSKFKGPIFYL